MPRTTTCRSEARNGITGGGQWLRAVAPSSDSRPGESQSSRRSPDLQPVGLALFEKAQLPLFT